MKLINPRKPRKPREPKNAAAKLAGMRIKRIRPCAQCLEDHLMLKVQKYCSNACKQAAKNARATCPKSH